MLLKKSLVLSFLVALACGAGDEGLYAIEAAGYTDVQMGDHAYWKCGNNDNYNSHFTATNANGRRVSGVVCCGMSGCGKACTVRF
jgi:hypothetical protein